MLCYCLIQVLMLLSKKRTNLSNGYRYGPGCDKSRFVDVQYRYLPTTSPISIFLIEFIAKRTFLFLSDDNKMQLLYDFFWCCNDCRNVPVRCGADPGHHDRREGELCQRVSALSASPRKQLENIWLRRDTFVPMCPTHRRVMTPASGSQLCLPLHANSWRIFG